MRQGYKIMHLIAAAILMACAGLGFHSCVREKVSACGGSTASTATLKVVFTYAPTDVEIKNGDFKEAVLYEFLPDGSIKTALQIADPEFNKEYNTGIEVGTEPHRLVAWFVNPGDPYKLTPPRETALDSGIKFPDARMSLDVPVSGTVTDKLPYILYGAVSGITRAEEIKIITIPMVLDNYVFNVDITGLPRDESIYAIRIKDNNGVYDFNNNYADGPFFYYGTTTQFSAPPENALKASLNTLRIGPGRSPQIEIINITTGKVIYPQNANQTSNLVELIDKAYPGNDYGKKHVYNIRIDIAPPDDGGTGVTVTVYIDGWKVVTDNHIIY